MALADFGYVLRGHRGRTASKPAQAPPQKVKATTTSDTAIRNGIRYLFDPLAFATEILKWTPDAKQREALTARRPRKILNWARQCGKTETAAIEAIHTAYTHPGSLVLVIGAVQDHISVFFDRIDAFLDQSLGETGDDFDDPINMADTWLGGPVIKSAGKRIVRRFPNRSRIVGLTTNKAVRSHTARFIILDEAGYIDNEVWEGVLPTLATTDGNILVIGTPRGAKGWYFRSLEQQEEHGRSQRLVQKPIPRHRKPAHIRRLPDGNANDTRRHLDAPGIRLRIPPRRPHAATPRRRRRPLRLPRLSPAQN